MTPNHYVGRRGLLGSGDDLVVNCGSDCMSNHSAAPTRNTLYYSTTETLQSSTHDRSNSVVVSSEAGPAHIPSGNQRITPLVTDPRRRNKENRTQSQLNPIAVEPHQSEGTSPQIRY